jgi:outer membrane protein assembly factor BamD (BamD/ComL family)
VKALLVIFAVLVGSIIFVHRSLRDGSALRYFDEHPQAQGVPQAAYFIGQTYFLFHDLPQAATYFIRIAERYPETSLAEDAYFNYLQSLDNDVTIPKEALIDKYRTYLEKYPEGRYKIFVTDKLGAYTTGGR